MKNPESMQDEHKRAASLIDRNQIEGLDAEEERWLAEHLDGCKVCSGRMVSTESAVQAVKSLSVPLPRDLGATTKLRMREEARKLKSRRARNLALVVGCTFSWVVGIASAPLVWRLFEWLGSTMDLPRIVWEMGFLSWWLVPAAAVGLVALWGRAGFELERHSDWMGMLFPPGKR